MNAPPFSASGAVPQPAAADTRTVTELLDSKAGSSRQAIIVANHNVALDTGKKGDPGPRNADAAEKRVQLLNQPTGGAK